MSFFENLKISSKIMTLLGLLGLFVVATLIFTASRMHHIDDTYSVLLAKDAKGPVMVIRLNTRLIDTGRLMYMIIAENEIPKMRAIDKELAGTIEKIREYSQVAKALLSGTTNIDVVLAPFESLIKTTEDIRTAALAGDKAAAMQMMGTRFEPGLAALRKSLNILTDATLANLEKASGEATVETEATIELTYIATAVGLVFVLALAVVLTRRYLSRPIVELGEIMRRLAEHDYTVVVHGTARKDEVGSMAQAVQVFKDGMIRAEEASAIQDRERQEREQRTQRIEVMTRDFDASVLSILGTVADAGTEMQETAWWVVCSAVADMAEAVSCISVPASATVPRMDNTEASKSRVITSIR
jgi:HAMP domain-containing protein